ncbi:MAG: CoA transferase, partial [Pseudomonadota bacterium]|nr:CoA transferase [Pseudomonadota bacterium]
YASMVLGDLGAQVYKIESKTHPDLLKSMQPQVSQGVSTWYQALNRNKSIIPLDLKDPQDHARALELVRKADILLEGFRPKVMERLGLGYQQLRKIKPDLIYCSISGYGQQTTRAGHDINFIALSGLNSFSGAANTPPPLSGMQIADVGAGSLYAVVGILTALWHRQQTGEGQYLDVALLDTTIALATAPLSKFLAASTLPQQGDDILNGGSIYGYYETQDGRYISVGSLEEKFRRQLATCLGLPQLGLQDREVLQQKFKSKTFASWRKIFADQDCCVEPSLNCAETFALQHCQDRGLVVAVPTNVSNDTQPQVAHPVRYSTIKPQYKHTGGTIV